MDGTGADGAVAPAEEAAGTEADEAAKAWTEVFTIFQQVGRDDRGAAYAMGMGSLRRKGEDLDKQLAALAFAEAQLLKHAREEAEAKLPVRPSKAQGSVSNVWGRTLARSLTEKVRDATLHALVEEEPWRAAVTADAAHAEAIEALRRRQQEQAQAEARAKEEEEARAKAAIEAAAKRAAEMVEAEKAALLAQGLNARRLPLRPGRPACAYFVRKGVCKQGKSCIWDHPETEVNDGGYPVRPGQPVCALYKRTMTCKFGAICNYDHPDVAEQELQDQPGTLPLAMAKAAAQQHQLQVLLHLQLLQETPSLQEPEAITDSWSRFRLTFAQNA